MLNGAEHDIGLIPLTSINVVRVNLPYIDSARARITSDMESMVITGLATLVRLPLSP